MGDANKVNFWFELLQMVRKVLHCVHETTLVESLSMISRRLLLKSDAAKNKKASLITINSAKLDSAIPLDWENSTN